MANVKMEELLRVQTVGANGRGVYPPVPTEEVDKRSAAGLERKEVQKSPNVLPHPQAVEDGAVLMEKDDSFSAGSNLPDPSTATDGMLLAVADGKWVAADPTVSTDVVQYLADAYSPDLTYSKGDCVIYDGDLYKAKQDIDTAEAWTSAHWEQTRALDEISSKADETEVSELQTALDVTEKSTGYYEVDNWTQPGAYLVTSGTTIDLTDVVQSANPWRYAIIPCNAGDKFIINAAGATDPRAWCFADSSYKSLSKASAGETVTNLELTAPPNSAWLFLNDKTFAHSYIGQPIKNRVSTLENIFFQAIPQSSLAQGFVYYQGGNVVETSTSGYYRTSLIEVKSGSTIKLDVVTSIAYQYVLLFDEDGNYIKSIAAPDTDTVHTNIFVNIPQNCKYIRFSIKTSQLTSIGITYSFADYYAGVRDHKAIITFIDDDTSSVAYVTRYYNALTAADAKGTFAVQTIELTNQSGLAELLRDYEEEGFGMCYHCHQQITAYNTGTTRDAAAAEADFVQGLREMAEAQFCDYKYWITPYGVYDATMQGIARRHGMKCLVSAANWAYNDPKYGDKYRILRADLPETDSGTHTISDLKSLIDDAYQNNAWIIVTTHINTWDSDNDSRITEIANYATTKGLECKTFPEAFSYYETAYNMFSLL